MQVTPETVETALQSALDIYQSVRDLIAQGKVNAQTHDIPTLKAKIDEVDAERVAVGQQLDAALAEAEKE